MKREEYRIIVMNFTGIYDGMESENVISFKDISGTDGYCSEEAKEEIRRRISCLPERAVHYLDSGNYHYLSEFWLEKIHGPFQLAMFDHHTDMQPSALLPLTSCGNWLLESLEQNPNLKKTWLIGPPETSYLELDPEDRSRVTFIEQQEADGGNISELLKDFDPELPVYLSVDKDVLSEAVLSTNWDQGTMTLQRLCQWIKAFSERGTVLGMDLCGEEAGADSLEVNRSLEKALCSVRDR
ncbi:MAG: arginase family protein [Lachnospiraceae bacterium]|nr:arginase family protein [Lachnospiraceae bacterium]